MRVKNPRITRTVLGVIFLCAILWIALGIQRWETIKLLTAYFFLFGVYVFGITSGFENRGIWLAMGVIGRTLLFLTLPVLSDDFYRFVWDGRLLANGLNPFAKLPSDYLSQHLPGIDQELYDHLNSPDYFTVYPPLNQLVFYTSVLFFPDNLLGTVNTMRFFILLAEIANYVLLVKLCERKGLPRFAPLIYFMNPLVILELTGNVHFEALMITFILTAIYLLDRGRVQLSAMALSAAISAKLLPLMYLPAFLLRIPTKKAFLYGCIVGIITLLSFMPLYSTVLLDGLSSSIGLYFRKFEFNASIYFLAREVGYLLSGYNEIAIVGPAMGLASFLTIIVISFVGWKKSWSFASILLMIHFFYLVFATTVHPWYVTTLVALAVLTGKKFPVWWSALIFLTYIGYQKTGYILESWVIILEYLLIFIFFIREVLGTSWFSSNINKNSSKD